jgi:hypothetical protein
MRLGVAVPWIAAAPSLFTYPNPREVLSVARKRSKARKRLSAQRKPTEQRTKEQQSYAVADVMWHALMKAVVTDERR